MNILKSTVLAIALACGASGAAQAVSFTPLTFDATGVATSFNVEFAWNGTPYNELSTFAVAYDFDLSLVSYSGTGNDQSGYILDDGTRLTTGSTACNSSSNPVINTGGCDLIKASSTPGVLFSGLSAGTYTLGVFDSATPVNGSVVFNVTQAVAPIPLPASALLLLAGLGGLVSMRRKTA